MKPIWLLFALVALVAADDDSEGTSGVEGRSRSTTQSGKQESRFLGGAEGLVAGLNAGFGGLGGFGANPALAGGFGGNPALTGGFGANPALAGGFGVNPALTGAFGANPALTGGFGVNPALTGGFGVNPALTGGFGVNPGLTGGLGVNPGLGGIAPVAPPSACRYWCRTPEGQAYCCEDISQPQSAAGVVKPGFCPPVRPVCPTRSFLPPFTCSNDGACGGIDKCCFDRCLGEHVCKAPQGIGR